MNENDENRPLEAIRIDYEEIMAHIVAEGLEVNQRQTLRILKFWPASSVYTFLFFLLFNSSSGKKECKLGRQII